LSIADKWIISRLQQTIEDVHQAYKIYRFDVMATKLYEFAWNEYCDWYLELSKPILYGKTEVSEAQQDATRHTLLYVLEQMMRLLHPVMPFITEEIWQGIKPKLGIEGDTLMLQSFPEYSQAQKEEAAEADIDWIKQVIVGIRNIRGEMNISPSRELHVYFANGSVEDKHKLHQYDGYLRSLAKISAITWLDEGVEKPVSATALVNEMEVLIPMAGLIDVDAEKARLEKEIAKLEGELKRVEGKLSNPGFVDKAPEAVVNKEKEKCAELKQTHTHLSSQLEKLAQI